MISKIQNRNTFNPDYVVHPGEILEETLTAQGISKKDFSRRVGFTPKTISLIIAGNASVTAESAIQFERVLGVPAEIWNNVNAQYHLFIERRKRIEKEALCESWIKKFPIKELQSHGKISKTKDISVLTDELVRFWGIGSPDNFDTVYNQTQPSAYQSKSFKASKESLLCWIRLAELCALDISTELYRREAFASVLEQIYIFASTNQYKPDLLQEIIGLCAKAGVAVVFITLPKTHISGAVRWLGSEILPPAFYWECCNMTNIFLTADLLN